MGGVWQVTEEEAKKIEGSKKEQVPASAQVKPDSTSSTATEKEEAPATASETKKVRVCSVQLVIISTIDKTK